MFLDVLLDVVIDTVKILPFLYLTYLLMEYLEEKTGNRSLRTLHKTEKAAPLFGAAIGVVPQCGFSAAAASLYSGGVITVGTLLAVFLSTSDEMLPIFLTEGVAVATIAKVLLSKLVLGTITGFAIDALFRLRRKEHAEKHIHDLCEREHCHCEEGNIWLSALRHTLQVAFFVFLISLIIGFAVELAGEEAIAGFLGRRPVFGVLLAGLIGLIPNCAASVMITEMYLQGLLGAGQMMAGLLVGAGVGLLVLFRTNKKVKDNLAVLCMLYAAGVFWGLLIELTGVVF